MKNVLVVCEKPYNRKVVEKYLRKHMPNNIMLHFDNIAFVTHINSRWFKNITKAEDGDWYIAEDTASKHIFYPIVLTNTKLCTDNYLISKTMSEKRIFTVDYDVILFACDPKEESVLGVFEYCQRNDIDIKKACFSPVRCMIEEDMENIFEKENWYPLTNSYAFTQFLYH